MCFGRDCWGRFGSCLWRLAGGVVLVLGAIGGCGCRGGGVFGWRLARSVKFPAIGWRGRFSLGLLVWVVFMGRLDISRGGVVMGRAFSWVFWGVVDRR